MKTKPQCCWQHDNPARCLNESTIKQGDYWFCDTHAGDRAKNKKPVILSVTTPPQPAHGEPKSAHDQIPSEHKASIQNLLYHPKFLARLLLEESEGAEGWAKAHADGTSVTEEGGKWISKHDAYAQKAKRFRDAAYCLNPDLSAVEVHAKETMDEVRAVLKAILPFITRLREPRYDAGETNDYVCGSSDCHDAIKAISLAESALTKLNPPQG